jgi:hypothetical protein
MGVFQEGFVRRHLAIEDYPICVETGTNLGYSTQIITGLFPRVYTIEIQKELYERAQRSFDATCILGDSATELPKLIPQLDEPTIFFLDAHWSGDSTTDWLNSHFSGYGVDTGMGTDQVPLLEEISAIVDLFPHRCAVYIDDMDKFDETGQGLKDKGFKGEDWSKLHLRDITTKLQPRVESVGIDEDQMLVLLRAL